jgi:hypothetical protein
MLILLLFMVLVEVLISDVRFMMAIGPFAIVVVVFVVVVFVAAAAAARFSRWKKKK